MILPYRGTLTAGEFRAMSPTHRERVLRFLRERCGNPRVDDVVRVDFYANSAVIWSAVRGRVGYQIEDGEVKTIPRLVVYDAA